METRSDEGAAAGAGDDLTPWGLPERRDHSKRVWLVVVLAVAGLVAVRFWDSIAAPFRDTPVAAFVALLPAGESVARDGLHRLDAGARFRLFAVLEARTLTGATVWYTEAPALRLGGREVPGDRLRRWPGSGRLARVRWWTVEGFAPYLQVATADDLERFRLPGNFHPDWGSGWSIDGVVDPRNALLEPGSPLRPLPFGTQRWQVRIEIYAQRTAITPDERLASPGGDELLAGSALPTALVAALPAPLARLSAVFGVTQVEAASGVAGGLAARHRRLAPARAGLRALGAAARAPGGRGRRSRRAHLAAARHRRRTAALARRCRRRGRGGGRPRAGRRPHRRALPRPGRGGAARSRRSGLRLLQGRQGPAPRRRLPRGGRPGSRLGIHASGPTGRLKRCRRHRGRTS